MVLASAGSVQRAKITKAATTDVLAWLSARTDLELSDVSIDGAHVRADWHMSLCHGVVSWSSWVGNVTRTVRCGNGMVTPSLSRPALAAMATALRACQVVTMSGACQ